MEEQFNNNNVSEKKSTIFLRTLTTLVLLIISYIYILVCFLPICSALPEVCALKWDFSGNVTGYGTKKDLMVSSILSPSLVTGIMIIVGRISRFWWSTALVILLFTKKPVSSHPFWKKEENQSFIRVFCINMIYLIGVSVNFCVSYYLWPTFQYNIRCEINPEHPVPCSYHINFWPPTIALIVTFLLVLGASLYIVIIPKMEGDTSNSEEDQHWHCAFYYNFEDKHIFVPKRYGIGWTLNMANPSSWIILACLFIFIIAAVCLTYILL